MLALVAPLIINIIPDLFNTTRHQKNMFVSIILNGDDRLNHFVNLEIRDYVFTYILATRHMK